ncbi:hypothetical protein BOX15_Mlig028546g1, partial [Macrostomum lignano]
QQHQELRLSGQWRFEAEDGSVLLGDRGSVVISQSNVERYVPSQPPSLASSVAGDDLAEDQMMSMFPITAHFIIRSTCSRNISITPSTY